VSGAWRGRLAAGALVASVLAAGPATAAGAVGESVTVNPSSGLPDTAAVNVSGSGFTPSVTAAIYECADVGGQMTCSQDPVGQLTTNASGSFSNVTVEVKAVFSGDRGASAECRTSCRVLVEDRVGRAGEASISFSRFQSSK